MSGLYAYADILVCGTSLVALARAVGCVAFVVPGSRG